MVVLVPGVVLELVGIGAGVEPVGIEVADTEVVAEAADIEAGVEVADTEVVAADTEAGVEEPVGTEVVVAGIEVDKTVGRQAEQDIEVAHKDFGVDTVVLKGRGIGFDPDRWDRSVEQGNLALTEHSTEAGKDMNPGFLQTCRMDCRRSDQ